MGRIAGHSASYLHPAVPYYCLAPILGEGLDGFPLTGEGRSGGEHRCGRDSSFPPIPPFPSQGGRVTGTARQSRTERSWPFPREIGVGAMSHALPRIILDDGYARQGHSAASWRYAWGGAPSEALAFDTGEMTIVGIALPCAYALSR